MWVVTFAAGSGDVESLYLNDTGLSGTRLSASVAEDTVGSALGGTYRLYLGSGHAPKFPLDANGAYLGATGTNDNETVRSEPLVWNASVQDVQVAINALLPTYAAEGIGRIYLAYDRNDIEEIVQRHPCDRMPDVPSPFTFEFGTSFAVDPHLAVHQRNK